MTHGWPGSVVELLDTVGPLTDPTAHGGKAEDAFHLVLPSLPGYGFSSEPAELGWDAGRTARAWAELMNRLGYTRYVAQGGDVGALVTDLMGRQAVEGLAGYHLNLLTAVLAIGDHLPKESDQERAAAEAFATFKQDGFGYFLEMATRPQTISYALLDSPVALAAWLLDHDTDSYYKISRAFVDGEPVGNLTRDNIIDNVTLYWLTGTAASAARSYWEDARALAAALASGQPPPPVSVPVGFTTFPGEIWATPRSWAEAVYPGLAYFNEVDRGGHFAAWEEPQLFTTEVRAAFRSLRLDARSAGRPPPAVPTGSAIVVAMRTQEIRRAIGPRMAEAAEAWLDGLDVGQREHAAWPFPADEERRRWYYTPTDHGGLTLGAMTPPQQRAVMRLLRAGLSAAAFTTATTIMGLENVLDAVEEWRASFGRRART